MVFLIVNNLDSFTFFVFCLVIAAPHLRQKIGQIFIGSSYNLTNFLFGLQHFLSVPIKCRQNRTICKYSLQSIIKLQRLQLAGLALFIKVIGGYNIFFFCIYTVFLFRIVSLLCSVTTIQQKILLLFTILVLLLLGY